MHSDPILVERLARLLDGRGLEQRVMFGGVAFFLDGNVCVGVWHDDLIARVGEGTAAQLAADDEHARLMDLTGRPMRAWLQVQPPGFEADASLGDWVDLAIDFVSTLPKKPTKQSKSKSKSKSKKQPVIKKAKGRKR